MHNRAGYSGWSHERVAALVGELMNLLGHTERADPLATSCSVNLEDYRTVKLHIPALRAPEAICLDVCFALVVRHPYRDSGIELVFDRREGFYPILNEIMKQHKHDRGVWWTSYVSKMTEIEDMRDSPEIQGADLLAWLAKRYYTHGSSDRWGRWFFLTFFVKKHYHHYFDQQALLSLFDSDGSIKLNTRLPPVRIKAPFATGDNAIQMEPELL